MACAVWIIASGIGLALLALYSNTPGQSQPGPSQWPSDSRIQLSNDRATLVLFVHPYCACTRASLGELERIVARYQDVVAPWVVFLKPSGTAGDWEKTDLWRTAAAIPGVRVVSDVDGIETRRFRARISGQTLLYDKRGQLLFDGGITFARGHSGDNAGRTAVETWLAGGSTDCSQTPVFGCGMADSMENEQGAD